MAVGDQISGIVGTGTVSDPYKPTTFGEFLSCIDVSSAYVCLENDIDVSKDNVYKTGISNYLNIKSAYVYGTAMTYDAATTYNQGDKCTWNDGDHGVCVYTCNVDGTVGIDISDTTHWTRGGSAVKKITGLIITNSAFMHLGSIFICKISNIFFESCVFNKSGGGGNFEGFINGTSNSGSGISYIFNDCSFSVFFNQYSYSPWVVWGYRFTLNRCSMYVKFPGNFVSCMQRLFASSATINNCTIDIEDVAFSGDNGYNTIFGNLKNSSIRLSIYLYLASSDIYISIGNIENSFISITIKGTNTGNPARIQTYTGVSGTNIIDKDVIGNATFGTMASNLIQGTTAQCKDKNWLISQGFFAS